MSRHFLFALRVATCTLALCGVTVVAQDTRPSFEVASIKPRSEPLTLADMGRAGPRIRPGGEFTTSGITAATLIAFAYRLEGHQLLGGPNWITRDLFAITAKAGEDVSTDVVRVMLQSLLADRFRLAVRSETREMPIMRLVLSRSDGQIGPYLVRVGEECDRDRALEATKRFPNRESTAPAAGSIVGRCLELSALATLLTQTVEVPVIDRTGLGGKWVYDLRYAPESELANGTLTGGSNLPSMASALEEQLGLKLEPARGPVDVLVIESIQRPTEN